MEVAFQLFLLTGGVVVALLASGRAVAYTRALAAALGAPAFIVGVVLVSIGTDLPEIANSVVAHLEGEGDVNVGDSVGSALTQYTLIVALFPLVTATLVISARQVGLVTALTVAGLVLTTFSVADGHLGRLDGAVLVAAWLVFTVIVVKVLPGFVRDEPPAVAYRNRALQAGIVLFTLGLVGFGATIAVRALLRLAELAGVPEFMIAFFGLSFGTSAPELLVDITALLRGVPGIALGDALGSSLVDATLSIGAGPLVAPADVTARTAVVASVYTMVAIAVAGTLLAVRRVHDRRSAVVLAALYALSYAVVIAGD